MADFVYDYAIVGGGCASFQLLYQMAQQPDWSTKRVLLLADKQPLQRSWCFWSLDPQPLLHHLIEKSWPSLTFRSTDFSRTQSIAPYQYHYLSGETFFRYFNNEFLPNHTNITRFDTIVDSITRQSDQFLLTGSDQTWTANQVFSSQLPTVIPEPRFQLWQHFSGWFIKTDEPVFDEQVATIMDFTIPQQDAVQFGYVLPFSTTTALVEITAFSSAVYTAQQYQHLLADYMNDNLPGVPFSIISTEQGRIPMTDFPFSRYGPSGETLIGTAAGMVKATTGYAFRRIGLDSKQLAQHGSQPMAAKYPVNWPATTGRFRFYDRLLLGIVAQQPAAGAGVFSKLFKHGSFAAILQFMDEESTLLTEAKLISRLPYMPFLNQLIRQWLC